MIYLNDHFFDFLPNVEYFQHNNAVQNITVPASIIGIALYEFYYKKTVDLIEHARSKTKKLVVYIKEPVSNELINLLQHFEHDRDIMFFGDAVLNVNCSNWKPAFSWFVSPRHYYQRDAWAKELLNKIEYADVKKSYYFDCLLGIERPHRNFIEKCYQQSNYKNFFIFNYFKDNINNGIWNSDIGNLTGTYESIAFNENTHVVNVALSALVPYDIYNQSYHSIIAETSFYNEFTHLTEKTAKPIMAERVFVAFAGQHYLRNLRSLGFQTFSDIIDESYDQESNNDKRFNQAWQQVEYLCTQDPTTIRNQVKRVLEHNRLLFLNSDWHQSVKDQLVSWRS